MIPFECAEGLQIDEMMGILGVLTVSELREMSCIPKKVCSCCLSCIYSLNVLSMRMIVQCHFWGQEENVRAYVTSFMNQTRENRYTK